MSHRLFEFYHDKKSPFKQGKAFSVGKVHLAVEKKIQMKPPRRCRACQALNKGGY